MQIFQSILAIIKWVTIIVLIIMVLELIILQLTDLDENIYSNHDHFFAFSNNFYSRDGTLCTLAKKKANYDRNF